MAQSFEIGIAEEQSQALSAAANVVFTAEESDSALSVLPFGDASLFVPPADILAVLGPRWRLFFDDNATGNPMEIYADPNFTLQHSQPATLDRFGQLPRIYLAMGVEHSVTVQNEFGVDRAEFVHQI